MSNKTMSKPDFASLFNLQFYRNQKKWKFVREVLTERSPESDCSQSERALLNQTYNVETPSEFTAPTILDVAFIDSANGADGSSGGEVDALTSDSSSSKRLSSWASVPVPQWEPSDRLCYPHTEHIFTDPQDPPKDILHQFFDNVTDYPHCDIVHNHSEPRPGDCDMFGPPSMCARAPGPPSTGVGALYARALHDYFRYIEPPAPPQPPPLEEEVWMEGKLLQQVEDYAKGWPQHSAVWTSAGQHPPGEPLSDEYSESRSPSPEMVSFSTEEHLLTAAQRWLGAHAHTPLSEDVASRARPDSPDGMSEYNHADHNLLLDKLTCWPRDRLLACSGCLCLTAGAGPCDVTAGCPPLTAGGRGRGAWGERSVDSDSFMLGAHTAPHSSEIELFVESSPPPPHAQVWRHAHAHAPGETARPPSNHSALSLASAEELPTRDVGPGPPSPHGGPHGRGRGPPLVGLRAGRPYRL